MSDLITTAQSTFRNQCIEVFATLQTVGHSLSERARDQRGQTAAEYMGILFIIAAIIGVVASLHLENDVSQRIKTLITDIGKGIKP